MCKFFSLISTGNGKPMYFDWELRKKCLSGEIDYNPDSHTSIADYFGYKGKKEDKLNKYEFNPLTSEFTVDQQNAKKDDAEKIRVFCNSVDFKTIVPQLIIKPIIHPFMGRNAGEVAEKEIALLKQWDSVRASVGVSVGDSVWDSVRASVGDSVWDSVRDSVWDSVWASVWDSVWDSVWAYFSSFFDIPEMQKYKCLTDLWESGFVPSFDGTTYRLHVGTDAKIVYEWRKP